MSFYASNIVANDLDELFDAIMSNNLTQVQQIVSNNPAIVKSKGESGSTPLSTAASKDRTDIAKFLIYQGADKDAGDPSPVWSAALRNSVGTLQVLIDNKANTEGTMTESKLPLHIASQQTHYQAVQSLLKGKANINTQTPRSLQSPLHLAVAGKPNHDAYDADAHKKTVKKLIKNGANVTLPDVHGNIPLHYAVVIPEYLLKYFGEALSAYSNIACQLMEKDKSSINHQNEKSETPLHSAVKTIARLYDENAIQDYSLLIDDLLEGGADPKIKDKEDKKAVDYITPKIREALKERAPKFLPKLTS